MKQIHKVISKAGIAIILCSILITANFSFLGSGQQYAKDNDLLQSSKKPINYQNAPPKNLAGNQQVNKRSFFEQQQDSKGLRWSPLQGWSTNLPVEDDALLSETKTSQNTQIRSGELTRITPDTQNFPIKPPTNTKNPSPTLTDNLKLVHPTDTPEITKPSQPQFVSGELLVKFNSAVDKVRLDKNGDITTGVTAIDTLFSNKKSKASSVEPVFKNTHEKSSSLSNVYKIVLPEANDEDLSAFITELKKNPDVVYAERNGIAQAAAIPNDPYFDQLWGLHNTGQTGGTPGADIHAPEAWDLWTGDDDIILAVTDTGVDYNHPDLAGKMWVNPGEDLNHNGVVDPEDFNGVDDDGNGFIDDIRGWDFVYGDNNPNDVFGHGTHCSGTAAAIANNGVGIAGVCWHCRIMPVKCLGDDGFGPYDVIANSIYYATDMGAKVISMSLGGTSDSSLLQDAVEYAYEHDVVIVVAAMNNNNDGPAYPAMYEHVIAVGATNHNDRKADFSNYGSWVDVSAPGVNILSTFPDNQYKSWQGTSMATPHVSGLAVLIRSLVPYFTNADVINQIISTTDNIDALNPGYAGLLGSGRINAFKALQIYEHNVGIKTVEYSPSQHVPASTPIHIHANVVNKGMNNETNVVVKLRIDGENVDLVTIPFFARNTNQYVDFTWMPPQVGVYAITVNVTIPDTVEGYYGDNERQEMIVVGVQNIDTGECFETIQQAINDSDTVNGHRISVPSGVYHESIVITKGISLQGMDKDTTIIDGNGLASMIVRIHNISSVSLTGFTIKNGSYGMCIDSSSYISIQNTIIMENTQAGVCLLSSNNVTIANNSIADNSIGIDLTDSSRTNKIIDNEIVGNQQGIVIDGNSTNNLIYYNLLNNMQNAYDECSNQWDNEYQNGYYPGGGNWWSDYIGADNYHGANQDIPGSDLVGDTPYHILGGINQDHYPLMNPGHLPQVRYVDDDNTEGPWDGTQEHPFKTIQEALDVAETGDTIYVWSGVYEGSLKINKWVRLLGENRDTTEIVGDTWYDLYVTADHVQISGFTITNMYPNYNYDDTAILLAGVSDCTITNNYLLMGGIIFASKEGYINGPLELNQWNTHVIEDNYAYDGRIYYFKNNDGPVIVPSDAVQVILANCSNATIQYLTFDHDVGVPIQLGFSSYNNIVGNTITQQYWDGILLRNSPANIISENQIIKLEDGDSYSMEILYESDHNIVKDNLLAYAWVLGIYIWNSSDVVIDNCTIINCGTEIWVREYSSHISITNCTISGSVSVWDSSDVLIAKNTASVVYLGGTNNTTITKNNICNVGSWGIRSDLCRDVIITDNFISSPIKQGRVYGDYYEGIMLLNALNHTVIGNTLISLGLTIGLVEIADEETMRLCYTSHTIENNTANGKPIYYYKNINDPFTVPLDAGQVILANCSQFTVQDISIDDVSFGVTAVYCSEITIVNATITNSDIGIVIQGSNTTVHSCTLYDNREYGINIYGSNNRISDSRIYDNEYSGVAIFGNQNSITNCVIYNLSSFKGFSNYGIVTGDPSEGTEGSSNNTILNCTLSNIDDVGILVLFTENNLVTGNSIANNTCYGVLLYTASHNSITDNLIQNTVYDEYAWPEPAGDGISLYESSSDNVVSGNTLLENYRGVSIMGSSDNYIYHNNFLRNNQNAYDNVKNTWDADEIGGNFWDDYTGIDNNNDGIGDTPYSIPGGSSEDHYPLTRPVASVFPIPAPKIVYVNDDYPPTISGWGYNRFGEIQEAIPNLLAHGTIYVSSGTYYENIVIEKPLTLQGENAETTIIRSSGSPENAISIRGTNEVTISNFTFTQGYCGIFVESSNNIFIHHNNILENTIGIAVNDQSHTIEIEENIIHGITQKTISPSQKNLIKDTKSITVQNTKQKKQINDKDIIRSSSVDGILLENTNNNIIRYNTITGNQEGIRITTGSNDNQIYNNNFIDNQVSAYDFGNENHWNRGPFGNYWSDYNGADSDGDGIGDTPYIISGGENQDSYPLMNLFNPTTQRVFNFDTRETFSTIQEAIDDPQTTNGQTLFVRSGVYHENIVVDKSLQLIGENKDTTIIYGDTGSEEENGMHLIAHRVSISGFTIQNCIWYAIYAETNGNIIRDNILTNNEGGIVLLVSSDNIIERNTITHNERYGIWIADGTNNVISGNTITHHGYDGIQMGATDDGWSVGPGCSNTIISGNYFYWNSCPITIGYDGTYPNGFVPPMQSNIDIIGNTIEINGPLFMWYTQQCNLLLNTFIGTDRGNYIELKCSANNNITGNTFTHMGVSIWLVGGVEGEGYPHEPCEYNVISKNTFQNGGGIIIDDWANGAYNNMIYFNNFIDSGAEDKCIGNIWDHGYPDGGNYWAGYTGIDENGDGIGDTPCEIGGNYPPALDRYPLMEPWSGELPKPKSVYVDDDYDETVLGWGIICFASVQEGVSAVANGGSVNVASGTYDEHVMIEKPLRLIGEDKDSTILTDSSRTGPIISIYNTHAVTITGFTIMHGEQGIFINSADNNVVFENVITQNQEGIRIEAGGINNHIYHNDFIMNNLNAYDAGSNVWDYDYPFGGNYWSDYTGSDNNNDGIGDTSYNISGGINTDRYPLMSPYELPVYEYPVTNLNTKEGFLHIQDAINDPQTLPGHSIYVQSGTYNEHLIVNKSVNLLGENQITAVIDGEDQTETPVVEIVADHVTLRGFTIRNSGYHSNGIEISSANATITDNRIMANDNAGIYLKPGASYATISKNTFGSNGFGIAGNRVSHITISDNLIIGGFSGIQIDSLSDSTIQRTTMEENDYGIYLWGASYVNITENIFGNNNYHVGILLNYCRLMLIKGNLLESALYVFLSDQNTIQKNHITGSSGSGLILEASSNNLITDCLIENNAPYGISATRSSYQNLPSNNNTFYHNTLINNAQNAKDECTNIWYNPMRLEGNHWSDYDQPAEGAYDNNNDGVADSPYNISGKTPSNQDLYPLMHPYVLGDMNLDGHVTFADIDPWVLALGNPVGYQNQYHIRALLHGDCNQDGRMTFADIDPFVALLNSGT